MKSYRFHPAAQQEYRASVEYYYQISPELARRFVDEIESLISEIRSDPNRFKHLEDRLRRHWSRAFPFALIFADDPAEITIVAVMHLKRRPRYWTRRLPA